MVSELILVTCIGGIVYFRYVMHQHTPAKDALKATARIVDVSQTSTTRWAQLGGVSERFAENALIAIYGKDTIDRLRADAVPPEHHAVVATATPDPIHFKPWEPRSFAHYTMQQGIAKFFGAMVHNLTRDKLMMKPQCLIGPAGRGKTTITKVLAQEIRTKVESLGLPTPYFIEAFGGHLTTPAALDEKIRLAASREGSVLFIDEVHSMPLNVFERMYMLLDGDHRYKFEDGDFPVELPEFTVLGATTDYGGLHEAQKRRFQLRFLQPTTPTELADILRHHPANVTPDAVDAVIARTHYSGAPWEALQIIDQARELATAATHVAVTADDVRQVFDISGIDTLGLRPEDRAVIEALFKCPEQPKVPKGSPPVTFYRASESNVIGMARVDPESYRRDIRPRLMSRGLLITHPKQCLTSLAVERYGPQFGVVTSATA